MKNNKFVDRVNPFKVIKKRQGKFEGSDADKFVSTSLDDFKMISKPKTEKQNEAQKNITPEN